MPLHWRRRHFDASLFAIDVDQGWARTWSRFYRLALPQHLPREIGHERRQKRPDAWEHAHGDEKSLETR
jgi:hypothetical protein